jgi:23S rRNA G2069 N7-methylase RlmK/C1962 C5-methylase RlmI
LHSLPDNSDDLAALLKKTASGVVFRWRDEARKGKTLARVVAGSCAEKIVVTHNSYQFEALPLHEVDPGAYPDSEPLREMLVHEAKGKRFLNLFAFTCLNGVVARLAGARSAVNVDIAGSHLERGKANYSLNGLKVDARDFVAQDALEWSKKAEAGRWDLIVVDPPPQVRRGSGHVPVEMVLEDIVARVAPLAAPGGTIHFLLCTARLSADELGARVRAAVPSASVTVSTATAENLDPRELPPGFKDAVIRI